jgi:hypothetical protein
VTLLCYSFQSIPFHLTAPSDRGDIHKGATESFYRFVKNAKAVGGAGGAGGGSAVSVATSFAAAKEEPKPFFVRTILLLSLTPIFVSFNGM